ncbi:MAG: GNAT family N-acetyltransferase [Oxalobacter sp.]|nr:MAG: GNAT family N-acetyltransferase [Oxalobacter sp.]
MELTQLENAVARPRKTKGLTVSLATREKDVLEAQKLRYRIFAEEMGANLPSRTPGVDHDMFDPYCEHLIVRDTATHEVVGTYRILSPEKAGMVGYYSESEFDISGLHHLRPSLVEIGRSCVHPDYRTGATIMLLWSGLAQYMTNNRYNYLMGCASISMADGGHIAASLYKQLSQQYMCPIEYRVTPRCPLPIDSLEQNLKAEVPPLIKGYLRAGAWICGDPAWDPDFHTADLHILMPMNKVSNRYANHYLGSSE